MILTRIRELRLEKGLTIKVLATELNIKESTLSKYERGEREPSIEALVLLSEFFDVSVDYLVGKDDYKLPEHKSISTTLGIDEKTIDVLKSLAGNPDDDYPDDITELDYLEAIMQHPQFPTLMLQINSYYVYTTADWSNYPPYYVDPNVQKIPITIEDLKNSALQIIQTTFKGIVESIPTAPHILNKE